MVIKTVTYSCVVISKQGRGFRADAMRTRLFIHVKQVWKQGEA